MTKTRLHSLDGIRGIASLAVIVGHSIGQAYELDFSHLSIALKGLLETYFKLHGFTVPVFMCLSGFVLGLQSVRHLTVRGGLAKYASRRAKRILPAYYFAFSFSLVVAAILGTINLRASWSYYTYNIISPAILLHDIWGNTNDYNVPFWSLPVEWHAYILLPAALLAWRSLGGSFATISVVLFSCVLIVVIPHANCHYYLIFFTGVGASYVCGSESEQVVQFKLGFPWRTAFLVTLVVQIAVLVRMDFKAFQSAHYISEIVWGAVAALLIVALSSDLLPRTEAFLTTRPIQWLGQRSYSMYLLHWPVLLVAQRVASKVGLHSFSALAVTFLAIVLPGTFALGSFSWFVFEGQSGRSEPRPFWPPRVVW